LHCSYKRKKRRDIEQRRHDDGGRVYSRSSTLSNRLDNRDLRTVVAEEAMAIKLVEGLRGVEASPDKPVVSYRAELVLPVHQRQPWPTHSLDLLSK
jgi:hypothetical protein